MPDPLIKSVVYVLIAGPFVKIGHTSDIGLRLRDLSVGCPYCLELIWSSDTMTRRHAEIFEKSMHTRFKHHHVRGEWFSASPYLVIEMANGIQQEHRRNDPNLPSSLASGTRT